MTAAADALADPSRHSFHSGTSGPRPRTTTMWLCGGSDHDDVTLSWFAAGPCGRLDGARARLRAGDVLVKTTRSRLGNGRPGSVASDEPAVRHGLRHTCRDDRGLGGAAASGVRGHRPARTRLRAALRGHYRHGAAG